MTATETSSGATVTAARRNERLTSLDAFRGFLILAMVFVNYLAGMAAIPFMLQHAAADQDLFTLADVVFPGFLFVVGVSIPLALTRRKAGGAKTPAVLGHISSGRWPFSSSASSSSTRISTPQLRRASTRTYGIS